MYVHLVPIEGLSENAFSLQVFTGIESEGIRPGMLVVMDPQEEP